MRNMKSLKEIINQIPKKFFLASTLGLALVVYPVVFYSVGIHQPNSLSEEGKALSITDGFGVRETGKLLKSEELIKSPTLFYVYVRLNNSVIQAGNYEIPSNLSIAEIVELLAHGTTDVRLTLIEGLRAEEIGELVLQKLTNFNYEDFMTIVNDNGLEGNLFPDTYFVLQDETVEGLVDLLTKTFSEKTIKLFQQNKTGLSEQEILILASIVEREEPTLSERPTVAGILISRYQNGELIGADATVQYAVGTSKDWWPKELTAGDLASDSPYNTRKIAGLPPGPICNPSLSAISSVINFKQTAFKYYLHDKEGVVHYAKTLEEHIQNQRLYL